MSLSIPLWAREIRADGWVNVHDILTPPRLTGVDAFLGDPAAHTLILGQDFGPADAIRTRLRAGNPDPFQHFEELQTNKRLADLLGRVGINAPLDGSRAKVCGVYYANANYLLREGDEFGGSTVGMAAAVRESARLLEYIISTLPKPLRVMALGKIPFNATASLYELVKSWRCSLGGPAHVIADRVRLYAVSHPSTRGILGRLPGRSYADCCSLVERDWLAAFSS